MATSRSSNSPTINAPYCKRAFTTVEAVTKADGRENIIHKDLPILGEASRIAA